ncbi:ECF-type sigma factor [Ferrimonas lipolytica]|uniref:Sigma-70 family RNA polymerase sigma factor n=1 Tax=Ferrimonas lipolytica TaxID=2724191 RepID=A0A6H1UCC9_9GAMM|nr:ECF-type sigma factor [Ferrimonas lipolytica]QIZ76498.1 sigma-70 family RNA polymerase sigma factor [Ferrimonas lipolytica]
MINLSSVEDSQLGLASQTTNGDDGQQMAVLLYQQLRLRARSVKSRLPQCATLDSRALIHEAYAKFAVNGRRYNDENHFLAVASTAMRHVLIDYLRQKQASKRDSEGVDLSQFIGESQLDQIAEIDDALKRFEHHYKREHDVAVYRIFGGLTVAEVANVVGVSIATVKRDWAFAQSWLYKNITRC